jgi:regulator of sigma D
MDELQRAGIRAETQAFWEMHTDLVKDYLDQYVAIYQGEVVDHDREVSQLDQRVRERFGLRPVLIAPVKPPVKYEIRWRGGRLEEA